jgi:hypothetical protein
MVKKIYVGTKPHTHDPEKQKHTIPKRVGLLSKVMDVVKEDIQNLSLNIKAITTEEPGWEEYKEFIELSKKGEVK